MHEHKRSAQQAGKTRTRRSPDGRSRSVEPRPGILALQRAAGNQATTRALRDRRSAAPSRNRDELSPSIEEAIRGPGHPLDSPVVEEMGAKFGHDFSRVQLHTGPSAANSAEAIGARAYTVGTDIVFGPGRYLPGTAAGQQLLAHELTHVVQQSRGGSVALGHTQYGQAEREASAAASQTGPVAVSQTVAPGTLQADDDGWFDTVAAVALGPVGYVVAKQHQDTLEDTGSWILGAIGGEFIDDPTYGQIGVDFVLSVIPYVDQVADARDIVAHIYRLGFLGEYTSVLRWIALAFTLIGLVPEIGSVIKSLSKVAIRFVGRNLDTVIKLVRRLIDLVPEIAGGMRGVRRFVASHWDDWARFGRSVWNFILSKGSNLADAIVDHVRLVMGFPRFLLDRGKRFLVKKLDDLRRMSDRKLPDVINDAKEKVLKAVDDVAERETTRPTPTATTVDQPKPPAPETPTRTTAQAGADDTPTRAPQQETGAPPPGARDTPPPGGGGPSGGLPGATGTRHLPREFKMPRHNTTTFPSTSQQIGTAQQRAAGRVRRRGERVGPGEQGTKVTELPGGRTGTRDHWAEHGHEFPEYRSARQYEQGAIEFCRAPTTKRFYYRHVSGRPTIGYYDVATNSFAATSVDGRVIFTYFRPDDVANYVRNVRTPRRGVTPRHSVPTRRD